MKCLYICLQLTTVVAGRSQSATARQWHWPRHSSRPGRRRDCPSMRTTTGRQWKVGCMLYLGDSIGIPALWLVLLSDRVVALVQWLTGCRQFPVCVALGWTAASGNTGLTSDRISGYLLYPRGLTFFARYVYLMRILTFWFFFFNSEVLRVFFAYSSNFKVSHMWSIHNCHYWE